MGRPSRRKKQNEISLIPHENIPAPSINAGAYIRLSVETDDDTSVETQLEMISDYITKQRNMILQDTYIDNGYTGTNFDRPEFQRMMQDVQTGKIQCIVVKDLSRFGRNFLEAGYYIETLLPKLNVRLIAINDDFDSSRKRDQNAISVPIKNMVNEMYARDYSKKVSKVNEIRRKSGNYTIETSVYGYAIDKENNVFIVNPDTAPIVQFIFRKFLAGYTSAEIAKRLNTMGVITPMEYKCDKEFKKEMTGKRLWDSGKVRMILRRETYMGDRCLGTKLTALYKNYKDKKMPRETWTVYKDNHEPIITREAFADVQAIMDEELANRRAVIKKGHDLNPELDNLFSNMVYCGRCGRKLHLETKRYANGKVKLEGAAYVCKGRTGPENLDGCYLRMEVDSMKVIVSDQLKLMVGQMVDQEKIIKKLRKQHSNKNPIHRYKNKIQSLSFKEQKCIEKTQKLYENLANDLLDQDQYRELRTKYQTERQNLAAEIEKYQSMLRQAEDSMDKFCETTEMLRQKYSDISLNRELLEYLVEKIVVYEGQRIEICLRCRDAFKAVTDLMEGGDTK